MQLKLLRISLPQNRGITPRLGIVEDHGLVKELEALNLLDGSLCS